MTKVFVSVVGDLLHVGHLKFLEKASRYGDELVVGVLTDEVVESYKHRPIIPLEERKCLIGALFYVDQVVTQNQLDPKPWLDTFEIDVIVHGDDWKDNFPGAEYMRSIGKQAINVPYYQEQSTTKIIEEILRRYREVKA